MGSSWPCSTPDRLNQFALPVRSTTNGNPVDHEYADIHLMEDVSPPTALAAD
jgi:hypothetical protein